MLYLQGPPAASIRGIWPLLTLSLLLPPGLLASPSGQIPQKPEGKGDAVPSGLLLGIKQVDKSDLEDKHRIPSTAMEVYYSEFKEKQLGGLKLERDLIWKSTGLSGCSLGSGCSGEGQGRAGRAVWRLF